MLKDYKNKIKLISINTLSYTLIAFFSIVLVFLSVYNIETKNFFWHENKNNLANLINLFAAISGFLGVISIYLFANKKQIGFLIATLNAIFLIIYLVYNGLLIDATLNFIYILIMIITFWKVKRGKTKNIPKYIISWEILLIIFILGLCVFLVFYFTNPLINKVVKYLIYKDYKEFGYNFNNFIWGSILLSTSNSVSVIALILMTTGFKSSWIIWCFKNIASILFFSGIGFLDITLILINAIYMTFSIYLFWLEKNESQIRFGFIGMGASGKSTIIRELSEFLKTNNIKIIDERLTDEKVFLKYMTDLKTNGYQTQILFFKDRLKQINEMSDYSYSLIDRHMIDDFLFPDTLIEMKYFNKKQILFWKYLYKPYYKIMLSVQPKVDYTFVVLKNYELIKLNRKSASETSADDFQKRRRTAEINDGKNDLFFKNINNKYLNNNNISNELNYLLKKYSKKWEIFIDEDYKESILKIKKLIKNQIFLNKKKGGDYE
ncbi:nicotinamide mononucleotide transporter family protein [Mycoplasmopsis felis]|uniref:nicotinamide mononucleotide transporter family protein n=1 Tax=Mycoplasmopsis felis TaxID=33923 RepID=UPI002AFDF743|nr:nicotinamide mononucleotide transporter family protein [Mycoplasmopsis felis]WQQ05212.1 nicotinamide mononucleotide transporter family protein [Mycoplasmopsis felis]